jgi:hypothetical protein
MTSGPACLVGATLMLAASIAPAQTHLDRVQALRLPTTEKGGSVAYYSKERQARARVFLDLVGDMVTFFQKTKGWQLEAPLVAVLNQKDWQAVIENPYGVPAVRFPGPISFVPADVKVGAVYRDILALWNEATAEVQADVLATCGSVQRCAADGSDAIITHELGHIYQGQAGIGHPTVWVGELVADYISYAYLYERRPPQFQPYLLIHRISAGAPAQFMTLGEFERDVPRAVPYELGRLHGLLLERVAQVYPKHGLSFLDKLAAAFPRKDHPTGCHTAGPLAGFCESYRLEEDEVLRRLEAIEPGFQAWAASFGRPRR